MGDKGLFIYWHLWGSVRDYSSAVEEGGWKLCLCSSIFIFFPSLLGLNLMGLNLLWKSWKGVFFQQK